MSSRNVVKLVFISLISALAIALPARGVELVVNGGFESGTLSGWTTSGLTVPGSCGGGLNATDWTVSNTGSATNCNDPGAPPQGTYAAYNMFDGGAPITYRLRQAITLPLGLTAATLTWQDAIVASFSGAPRVFSVNILNSTGSAVLGNLYTYSATGSENTGWVSHSVNATSLLSPLAGQQVVLEFAVAISQAWTGPAGMGLDAVSLTVPAPIPTMSEWGMAILFGLMVCGTFVVMRHRQV